MERVHLYIRGRVQGVGFRYSTVGAARRIGGLTGWVRNLDDGRVEAVVEGEAKDVDALVAWCRRGPPAAAVEDVEVLREPASGEFRGFDIRD